jgi:hypothetical protein
MTEVIVFEELRWCALEERVLVGAPDQGKAFALALRLAADAG